MCLTAVKSLDFAEILWFSGTFSVLALMMSLSLFVLLDTFFCTKGNTRIHWAFSPWAENRSQWKWTMVVSGGTVVFDSSSKTLFNLQSIRTYINGRENSSDKHSARKHWIIPQCKSCAWSFAGYTSLAVCCTEVLFVGLFVICFFFFHFTINTGVNNDNFKARFFSVTGINSTVWFPGLPHSCLFWAV